MRPPLHCDICGHPMEDDHFYACEHCRSERLVPTNESLARVAVLNAPYWAWISEQQDFERIARDEGMECRVLADGSVKFFLDRKDRERWEHVNAFHVGA